MDERAWSRYAALGGVWFVVLNLVGSFLAGSPPASDDPADKIVAWFADHTGAIELTQLFAVLGTIGLAWWFGSVWRMMVAAEDGQPRLAVVALIGLVLSGAAVLVSGAITSAVALRIDDVGAAAGFFFTLAYVLFGTSAAGGLILVAAVSALSYRTKMLPAWVTYLGWLSGLGYLVGTAASASDASAFTFAAFGGFLLWCVWILAISAHLWGQESAAAVA